MTWEESFTNWALPPSKTEQDKCENAVQQIRKAIDASKDLQERTIQVFAQGSYRNRTNVRRDSDVDVCVLCTDLCFVDYSSAQGLTDADTGLKDNPYTYSTFKDSVGNALKSHFGSAVVTRGNKAFDIHENTYRVDADVIPCFEHRRYVRRTSGALYFHSGTQFNPDNGGHIVNWPQQNYDNGVAKNETTSRCFKAGVRILKCLRNVMDEESIAPAKPISSYLLECLAWNVPDNGYEHETYTAVVQHMLAHLFNNTKSDDLCIEWGEINELKYLLRPVSSKRQQVHAFVSAAWDYIGFD